MSSVEWVVTDGKYEVSSRNHLLQIMSQGGNPNLNDTGSPPTAYWSSDYVQTADIDLQADPLVSPIGSSTEPFVGSYDGSGFSITDWTYQDPSRDDSGLFGYLSSAVVKNVNLEGTWILSCASRGGLLAGTVESSSGLYNITADFSAGSVVSSGDNVAALVGTASASVIEGLTIKGTLSHIEGAGNVGGVLGSVSIGTSLNYVRNMVRFTDTAISGDSCSGVCCHVSDSNCSYIMNAMVGNITGINAAGGVFGTIENGSSDTISHVVVSINGSVSSTAGNGESGGIAASAQGPFEMNTLVNYSTGDVTGDVTGGLVASVSDGVSILNSVVALNGSVQYAGVQAMTGSTVNTVEAQIITSFGMNHTDSGVTTELTALSGSFGMHEDFSSLEYFPYEFSDTLRNTYVWEFVFGNISGSNAYSQTHAVISSGDVCGPIQVQVDLPDASVEYLYIVDINSNEVVTSPGVSVIYSSGTVTDTVGVTLFPVPALRMITTSPFSIELSWDEVQGAVKYRVDYGPSSSSDSKNKSITSTTNSVSVMNLDSDTEYSFQVYSSDDGENFDTQDTQDATSTVTMPENSADGYIMSRFLVDDKYDLSGFSPEKTSQVASIMSTLLGQDESVLMKVNGETRELLVAGFTGGSIDVEDGDQYILPFDQSSGSGQTLSIDGVFQGDMYYDESVNSITLDGTSILPGNSVIIGNTRVTLVDLG